MNVENEWSDSIDASKVEGAVRRIEAEEVRCAMNRMKLRKASGPSAVALEMFKAGRDKCLKSLTNIFNDILFKNKLPEEWMLSSLVPIFKGKGDPLNPNSYRGIKLLEHAFKLYEKILDGRLREVVDIDKMQYGFMPGRGILDVVFVLRRLTEKFRAKNKKLFFVFVDLEKAFDQGVIRFALRWKGVPEYLVNGVMSLYKGCKTAVVVDGEPSSSSSVKVGVHEGSALSPLLFIMVTDVLTEDVRDRSLMKLLYADDLVLYGESINDVMGKYKRWKNAVEGKGLRVNVDKAKGMQLSFGKKSSVSKVDPCRVCGERVGCNSIQCTKCQRWVHHRCSDVPRQVSLLSCRNIFVCGTCLRHNCSVVEKLEFKTGEDILDEVEKFCYLGDMISCFGGASEAVSARIGGAWKKFRELSGVLVGKQGLPLMQREKIYQCCVRTVLLYCCETWELTVADKMRLRGVERRKIRMMCGVRLVDRVSTDVLRDRVGVVVTIEDFIIQRRLRWYGHVIRRDISYQIREVMEHEIPGKRKKGRPRKT